MNLPDVTLFLQIANFAIAYAVMRTLIFAPALKIIGQQDFYKKSLEQNIATAKMQHQHILMTQKSSWQKARESLYALVPKLSRIFVAHQQISYQNLPKSSTLSSQEKKVLVQKLCDQLSDVKL